MDFKEAKDLSLQNPGSTITRDEHGDFVVRMPNGRFVNQRLEEGSEESVEALHRQLDLMKEQNNRLGRQLKKEKSKRHALEVEVECLKAQHDQLETTTTKTTGETEDLVTSTSREMERDRVIALAESGRLSSGQIQQLLDQASQFDYTSEERDWLTKKLHEARTSEARRLNPESFIVHAKTDGQ